MSYVYDLPSFKKYLNDLSPKNKVDGLTFWQNKIPLPIDIFNKFFNESGSFFYTYIDHLIAALVAYEATKEGDGFGGVAFDQLPTKDLKKYSINLVEDIDLVISENGKFKSMAQALSDLLEVDGYEIQAKRIYAALTHQGKKYSRIYCPSVMKDLIDSRFPGALDCIALSNADMFGNVIADHYGMYRAGFNDALVFIFNKQIDFRLLTKGSGQGLQRISISVVKNDSNIKVLEERIRDGSLWEPGYDEDHLVKLNPEHPFFKNIVSDENTASTITELLYCLCQFENNQFSDTQRKLLENMRQEVSRELWIKFD